MQGDFADEEIAPAAKFNLGSEPQGRLIKLGHDARMMPPAYVKPYGAPRRRVSLVEEDSAQRVVD